LGFFVKHPFVAKAGAAYRADMNQHGAVSAFIRGKGFLGLKPGEFDFVCPYADGETRLDYLDDGRQQWVITPRESRLWVKETFYNFRGDDSMPTHYRADERLDDIQIRWKPSIFMPRDLSRLTLEVVDVRVERVNSISEEDARAEGIRESAPGEFRWAEGIGLWANSAHDAFGWLWNSINAKRPGCSWEDNPWTWCVSFRRIE